MFQPLDQFDIFQIQLFTFLNFLGFFIDLSYVNMPYWLTNITLYLMLIIIFYFWLVMPITKRSELHYIPFSIWQHLYEIFFFKFVYDLLKTQIGSKYAGIQLPYGVSIFFFILLSNFIGLIPFFFTVTSHVLVTFMLGFCTILGLTIIGFIKQKLRFLELFVPKGVPKMLLPLLVIIEVVSYISRGFSLSIRLFANLMSGHSLLHILLFFMTKILKNSVLVGLIGLALITAIFILELGIAFLQAYVFIVLISIYLKDSYGLASH